MESETTKKLSCHDNAILNKIFNPNLPYTEETRTEEVETEEEEEETQGVVEARQLEVEGVRSAENGDPNAALTFFDQAITLQPSRPSGYNNRAQALRLMGRTQDALSDLDQAVELSGGHGKAACQALTQRGLIYRLQGEDDKARDDFTKAAALGSQFAKSQLIALNPYAALCNEMMVQMIERERTGQVA